MGVPKKNVLIVAGIVVILALFGVVGYFVMSGSKGKSDASLTGANDSSQDADDKSSGKNSIKSLLTAGKNTSCTVAYPNDGGSGTIFVADKKMRGDFNMKDASGKITESHMVFDGDMSYFWTGTQGTKMMIDANAKATPTSESSVPGADLDNQMDMNCAGWSVDNSKFTVPSNVTFMDMGGMMKQTQTQTKPEAGASSVPSIVKSACESIADPSTKAACISAAGEGN